MIPVYPNVYSNDADGTQSKRLHVSGDTCCTDIPAKYRTISGSPYCTGYDKYVDVYDQISYDDGQTWETTATTTTLLEHNSEDCGYIPPIYRWIKTDDTICEYVSPYSGQYLKFIPLFNDGTFKFSGTSGNSSIQYSLDSGSTWSTLASGVASPTVSVGNEIWWKGNLTPASSYDGIGTFSSTVYFDVEGNAHSLLWGDDFEDKTSLSGKDYVFEYLFSGCTGLNSAENLVLPATILADGCYEDMFRGCVNLLKVPSLPARTLANRCYSEMFAGCINLTTVSSNLLPATALADECYNLMFVNCTSLTTAPELPATTMAWGCYSWMFENCTSLSTAPSLPATTLAASCYESMFYNCTLLTTAPELPATTMANGCYLQMFRNCTSLTTMPSLPAMILAENCYAHMFNGCNHLTSTTTMLSATTLADRCYEYMFSGCTRILTSPTLPATTLEDYCYQYMFDGCMNLSVIKCLATDISATDCTNNWVNGVASSGTFVKAPSMSSWTIGSSGIPTNWTVQSMPEPPYKFIAYYSDGVPRGKQCDSSSAITSSDITSSGLTSIEIGDCVTIIGNSAFMGCSGLTSCTISSGVTSIQDDAFFNCRNLKSIDIPDNVTTIGNDAFCWCDDLESLVIGSGVTSIGSGAFQHCCGLTSVIVKAITPPSLYYYSICYSLSCPIYVPEESINAYKADSWWSTYNIQPMS